MATIPQNIKKIPAKVASEILAKIVINPKTLKPISQKQLNDILKNKLIKQQPWRSISRQQWQGLEKDITQKSGFKISQTKKESLFKKESEILSKKQKKENVAYVRKQEFKKRGELMTKRLHGIKDKCLGNYETKPETTAGTLDEEKTGTIKNPTGLRKEEEETSETDKQPTPVAAPDFVEPDDMFL